MSTRYQVSNIDQLKLGVQISFPTSVHVGPVGKHHAIVTGIICIGSTWYVRIIDFASHNGISGDLSKQGCIIRCSVEEHLVDLGEHIRSGKLWCHIYPDGQCYDSATVIDRARQFIGSPLPYNLLTNNCEHFATWCMTGVPTSTQIDLVFFALILILIIATLFACAWIIFRNRKANKCCSAVTPVHV